MLNKNKLATIVISALAVFLACGGVGIAHAISHIDSQKTYTVMFNPSGGESIKPYYDVPKGSKIKEPKTTKKGYEEVVAWKHNGVEWDFKNDVVTSDMMLKAVWGDPITYSIAYDLSGGEVSRDNPTTYTVEDEFVLQGCVKNGYQFNGWINEETNLYQTCVKKGTTGDLNFTASFTANYYNISLNSNLSNALDFDRISAQTDSNVVLSYPLKDGYSLNNVTSNDVDFIHDPVQGTLSFKMPANNISFNFDTSIIQYKITYHNTYDAINDNITSFNVESYFSIGDLYGRKGYTFVCWVDEKGNPFPSIVYGHIGDIDLYATWTKDEYSITYDLDEGENDERNPSTYSVDSCITLYEPTKPGYVFKGWESTSGEYVTTIGPNQVGDIKLTAIWVKLITFWFEYEEDGQIKYYYIDLEQSNTGGFPLANVPTGNKYGHYFSHWTETTTSGTIIFYSGDSLPISYCRNFAACYLPYICTVNLTVENDVDKDLFEEDLDELGVTYTQNGNTYSFTLTAFEGLTTLPTPYRDGHQFSNWKNSDTNADISSIPNEWDNKISGVGVTTCSYNLVPVWSY